MRTRPPTMEDRSVPTYVQVLPVACFGVVMAMYFTHRNFQPSHAYLLGCALPVAAATAWLTLHIRGSILGCVYRPRGAWGGDYKVYEGGAAWARAFATALLCAVAVAFFVDSFGNTVFGTLSYRRYLITGTYLHESRFTRCNGLRVERPGAASRPHHFCVSAAAARTLGVGQHVLVGDQRSWFGNEVTSYRALTP